MCRIICFYFKCFHNLAKNAKFPNPPFWHSHMKLVTKKSFEPVCEKSAGSLCRQCVNVTCIKALWWAAEHKVISPFSGRLPAELSGYWAEVQSLVVSDSCFVLTVELLDTGFSSSAASSLTRERTVDMRLNETVLVACSRGEWIVRWVLVLSWIDWLGLRIQVWFNVGFDLLSHQRDVSFPPFRTTVSKHLFTVCFCTDSYLEQILNRKQF